MLSSMCWQRANQYPFEEPPAEEAAPEEMEKAAPEEMEEDAAPEEWRKPH